MIVSCALQGGAIYKDGGPGDVVICGSQISNNKANAFGAAAFLTADTGFCKPKCGAKLNISDSLFVNNSGLPHWEWCPGVSTDDQHSATLPSSSPEPVNSTFCDAAGECTQKCTTMA